MTAASQASIASKEAQVAQKPTNQTWGMTNNGWKWFIVSHFSLWPLMVHRKGIANARLFITDDNSFDPSPFSTIQDMLHFAEPGGFATEAVISPYWGSIMDRYGCGLLLAGTWGSCAVLNYLNSYSNYGWQFVGTWLVTMACMCTGDAVYQTMFRSFGNFMDPGTKSLLASLWVTGYQVGSASASYWVHFTENAEPENRWRVIFRYIQSSSAAIYAGLVICCYPWAIDRTTKASYKERVELRSADDNGPTETPFKTAMEVRYAKRVALSYGAGRALKYLFFLRLAELFNKALLIEKQKAMYASTLFDFGGFCSVVGMAFLVGKGRYNGRNFAFATACGRFCLLGLGFIIAVIVGKMMEIEFLDGDIDLYIVLAGVFFVGMCNGQDAMLSKNSPMILEQQHRTSNPGAPNCAQMLRGINYSTACVAIVVTLYGQSFLNKLCISWFPSTEKNPYYSGQMAWVFIVSICAVMQTFILLNLIPLVKLENEILAEKHRELEQ